MNQIIGKSIKFLFSALLLVHCLNGQSVNFNYGSGFNESFDTGSLFYNEAGVGYMETPTGVLGVGYFNNGFDVANGAAGVTDVASLTNMLTNFNLITEQSFKPVVDGDGTPVSGATAAGFFNPATIINDITVGGANEALIGKSPYLLILGGIESYSQLANADEVGLFSDTSFGTIPTGASPLPEEYDLQSPQLSSVVLGGQNLGQALNLMGLDITANIYSTQSLGAAVPEPSTYALFLGVFSLGFVVWRKRAVKNATK